jgi:hypothetical protein
MSDDLVERVARLYEDAWGIKDHWRARQAIAIALEEAARVAEIYEYDELEDDGGATIKPSAAIRAMINNGEK